MNLLRNDSAVVFHGDCCGRGHRQVFIRHRHLLLSLVLHLLEEALLRFLVALDLLAQIDDDVLLGLDSLLLLEIFLLVIAALAIELRELMPQLRNDLHLLGNYLFILCLLLIVQVLRVLHVQLHAVY